MLPPTSPGFGGFGLAEETPLLEADGGTPLPLPSCAQTVLVTMTLARNTAQTATNRCLMRPPRLETARHLDGNTHRVCHLRSFQNALPAGVRAERFLRYDHHIAGTHVGSLHAARKQASITAHYRAIRPNDKYSLFIRHVAGTAGLLQLPLLFGEPPCRLVGFGGGAVDGLEPRVAGTSGLILFH